MKNEKILQGHTFTRAAKNNFLSVRSFDLFYAMFLVMKHFRIVKIMNTKKIKLAT